MNTPYAIKLNDILALLKDNTGVADNLIRYWTFNPIMVANRGPLRSMSSSVGNPGSGYNTFSIKVSPNTTSSTNQTITLTMTSNTYDSTVQFEEWHVEDTIYNSLPGSNNVFNIPISTQRKSNIYKVGYYANVYGVLYIQDPHPEWHSHNFIYVTILFPIAISDSPVQCYPSPNG